MRKAAGRREPPSLTVPHDFNSRHLIASRLRSGIRTRQASTGSQHPQAHARCVGRHDHSHSLGLRPSDTWKGNSMNTLRFDGRVAAVTGAGNGLGRAYAIELALRGAKVIVNDLGSAITGDGADEGVARGVVDEIVCAGGEAVPHFGDVSSAGDMQAMIDLAIGTWGRIDILVTNAGSMSGNVFSEPEVWDRSLRVNLHGVVNPLRAAWPHFVAQNYGRIVNTSSSSMMGSPHSLPYAASKAAVVGLTKVLANSYPDMNVRFNALMPTAWSRMTGQNPDGIYRDWLEMHFPPEKVASFVAVLCHESLELSGEVFSVGGGRASRVLFELTDGWWDAEPTAESFAAHLDEVMSGSNPLFASSGVADLARYVDWFGDPADFPEELIQRARAGRTANAENEVTARAESYSRASGARDDGGSSNAEADRYT